MSQVKRSKGSVKKTAISRDRLNALKDERAKLREHVHGLTVTINRITPKVRANLVYPNSPEHPSSVTDEIPVVVIEIEFGSKIYQGTLSAESFKEGRTPEKLCHEFGIVAASQLMGPIMSVMVKQKAEPLLMQLQEIIKDKDPQTDAFDERKAG